MGADNWEHCPRCIKQAEERQQDLKKQAEANYGKVPIEEFNRLQALASVSPEVFQTFREDYAFSLESDCVYAEYCGRCTECGFSIAFKHQEPFNP